MLKQSSGLEQRTWQGYYGESFIRVLAASAGLIVSRADLDVTGEDFTVGYPGQRESLRYPKIDVQIKSWSRPTGTATSWRYRMRAEHYNELAGGLFYLPRYLFLVVVPDDPDRYTTVSNDALRLHRAGYWASFGKQRQVSGVQSLTVDVPRRNLLTPASLRALFSVHDATLPGPRSPW